MPVYQKCLGNITQDSQTDNSFEAGTIFTLFTFDLSVTGVYVADRHLLNRHTINIC